MKSKIFINQNENNKYFKQKLPTWRNGYCEIMRNVTILPDPYNVYDNWGTIEAYGQKLFVYADNYEGEEKLWEISGVARNQGAV
jgi:hypothetical protein